jgi:hypothetical protein
MEHVHAHAIDAMVVFAFIILFHALLTLLKANMDMDNSRTLRALSAIGL